MRMLMRYNLLVLVIVLEAQLVFAASWRDPLRAFVNACLRRAQPKPQTYEIRPYPAQHFDRARVAQAVGINQATLFGPQADNTNYFLQQYNNNLARLHSATPEQYLQFLGALLQAADADTYHRLVEGDLNPQLRNLIAAIQHQQNSERVLIDRQRRLYVRFELSEVTSSRFPHMFIEKEEGAVTADDLNMFGGRVHFRPDRVPADQVRQFTRLSVPKDVPIDRAAQSRYPREFGKVIHDSIDVIMDGPDWARFTTILQRLGISYNDFSDMVWAAGQHKACELILEEVTRGGLTAKTTERIKQKFSYSRVQGRTQTAQLHFNHQPFVSVYRQTQFNPAQLIKLARTGPLMDPQLILADAPYAPWVGPGVDATFTIDKHHALKRLASAGFNLPMVQSTPTVPVVIKAIVPASRLSKKSEYARFQ